jgi:hypothetical protein
VLPHGSVSLYDAAHPLSPLRQSHGHIATEWCTDRRNDADGPGPESSPYEEAQRGIDQGKGGEGSEELDRGFHAFAGGNCGEPFHYLEGDDVDEDADQGKGDRGHNTEHRPHKRRVHAARPVVGGKLGIDQPQEIQVSFVRRHGRQEFCESRIAGMALGNSAKPLGHGHPVGQRDGRNRAQRLADNYLGDPRQLLSLIP